MNTPVYYTQRSVKTRFLNMLRSAFKIPVFERLLAKAVSGHEPNSFRGRLVPLEYQYAKGAWRTITRSGLKYRLDISNTVDYWAYFNFINHGDIELDRLIKPDDTVVDIGANIGTRAMDFARLAPQGTVIGFEPDPDTHLRLLEHIRMNGLTRLKPINKGIGPVERNELLHRVVDNNPGMNRIITNHTVDDDHGSVQISLTPLSPVLSGLGINRVNVIKIDVEGFEFEVLKGCEDVIDAYHPILFIELDNDNLTNNGSTARELVDWVRAKGYHIKIAGSDAPLPTNFDNCHFDILCIHAPTQPAEPQVHHQP
ncbi:MAG: FkbM family methyltransferase [Flavobacteriales bacterium]|nr:FkbM family methyltransferase [Flavobacteriales bacterium]MEB2340871.1 FkbM family methyltransferase [Flavobacteriia bacterium]